jgi:hypothetical protein
MQEESDMSSLSLREKLFAASTLAGLMGVVAVAQGLAQQKATPPDGDHRDPGAHRKTKIAQ